MLAYASRRWTYALWFAKTPTGLIYASQNGLAAGMEDPSDRPYVVRAQEPIDTRGPEPWYAREHTTWAREMHETSDPAGKEFQRWVRLDEGSP